MLDEVVGHKWPVGEQYSGRTSLLIETLVASEHGIGPLLVYDIAVNDRDSAVRELADTALGGLAQADETDVASAIFDRVPRVATSISARIAPVFRRAQADETRWDTRRFRDYLGRPSFGEAAESVVFSLLDAADRPRPLDLQVGRRIESAPGGRRPPASVRVSSPESES